MSKRRVPGRPAWIAALLPLFFLGFDPTDPPASGGLPPELADAVVVPCEAVAVRRRIPDPFAIPMAPTANANGAAGSARLTFAMTPFGVSVTEEGHHRYRIHMRTSGLDRAPGTAQVVWAVTPTLDEVRRLGALDAGGELVGEVALNKFLVFVTAEPSAEVERWSGPILLRGISRSGRMHTMLGHGPFEGEAC